jgi:hypothetical protein
MGKIDFKNSTASTEIWGIIIGYDQREERASKQL